MKGISPAKTNIASFDEVSIAAEKCFNKYLKQLN